MYKKKDYQQRRKVYDRRYYKKHRKERIEAQKKYYQKNKEKILPKDKERKRIWYQKKKQSNLPHINSNIFNEYGEEIQTIFPLKETIFNQPFFIFDTTIPRPRYERVIRTVKGDNAIPKLLTNCGLFIYVLKKNGKECGYKLTSEILNFKKMNRLPGRRKSSELQMDLANFQFRLIARDYDSGWVQGKKVHGFYKFCRI